MTARRGGQGAWSGTPTAPTPSFKVRTLRLEDVHFTAGLSTSAVNFHDVVRDLSTYVGTCNYRGAAAALLAISEMALPTFMTTKKVHQHYWN